MLRTAPTSIQTDEPAIKAVDSLLAHAIAAGASDLHIAPTLDGGLVRVRVNGTLRRSGELSADVLQRVVSRIKLLAGMDIADRRQPQDGRYDVEHAGLRVDLRVSSLPTIDGERLSIRLLNRDGGGRRLDQLGMSATMLTLLRQILSSSSGFVIMCGPTGSGKTTTLYAALNERDVLAEHICSVEDPVELRIVGIAQVQVNARAGLTFAGVLRAFLRQDPDVLVIGEMRDAETAQIAATAALCGRLVLTTLHTTSAVTAFERLRELGVGPRTLASAVTGVLGQQLVRVDDEDRCSDARTAVFELLTISDDFRYALQSEAPLHTLAAIAVQGGYRPIGVRAA